MLKYDNLNAVRNNSIHLEEKFKKLNICIIGLGGTGSYILDHISKCPMKSITLIDDDTFEPHNAFRAPGSWSSTDLEEAKSKVDVFKDIYSKIQGNIVAMNSKVDNDNVCMLKKFDYVFVSIDGGRVKNEILSFLTKNNIPFSDSGIGMSYSNDNQIRGQLSVGTFTTQNPEIVSQLFSVETSDENGNAYGDNIQLSEINALAASLSVINFKKYIGYYYGEPRKGKTIFNIRSGGIIHGN